MKEVLDYVSSANINTQNDLTDNLKRAKTGFERKKTYVMSWVCTNSEKHYMT